MESSLIVNNGKTWDSSAELTRLSSILTLAEFLPGVRSQKAKPIFLQLPTTDKVQTKVYCHLKGKKNTANRNKNGKNERGKVIIQVGTQGGKYFWLLDTKTPQSKWRQFKTTVL